MRLFSSVAACIFGLVITASDGVVLAQFEPLLTSGGAECCTTPACGAACPRCEDETVPCLCDPTPCGSKSWLSLDYASYWTDGFATPDLVSTSPTGTPRQNAGVRGTPGANTMFGGDGIADQLSGFRLEYGHWLDDCGKSALTTSFLWLNGSSLDSFPTASDPGAIISRPFFNASPGVNREDAELVNFPGVVDGTIDVATDAQLFSGSIGLQTTVCCSADACCCAARRIDRYIGFRNLSFDESLTITELLRPDATSGLIAAGTELLIVDQFRTENDFNGVEFGISAQRQRRRWVFGASTRFTVGNIRQRVVIDGSTTTTVPGAAPVEQPYGFLAAPSNIGTYERNEFGYLTDAWLELGYWLSSRCKLRCGYNLLFVSSVVRPGSVISTDLNTTQIDPLTPSSGNLLPTFSYDADPMLLHGLRIGVDFRW